MSETLQTTTSNTWGAAQASALIVVCLLVGVAGGWLVRKSTLAAVKTAGVSAPTAAVEASQPPPANFGMGSVQPSAEQLKLTADTQAAPMLERLKAEPNNAGLLTGVGNIYYDAKQYPTAIEYYERALKVQPSDAAVRTDLGTAYWYTGNADKAIAEFNQSLSYEPNKADTLFNLGIVKWQGKKDGPGAIGVWRKLLETNPEYSKKEEVLQLIAQAQQR